MSEFIVLTHASECEPGDALICDPPFSDRVHDKAVSNNPGGVETGTRKRDFGFDSLKPGLVQLIAGLMRDTPGWSVVFSDIESIGSVWQPAAPKAYVRSVPWVRWSQPQKSGDRPCSGAEMTALFHPPGKKVWNGLGSMTSWWAKSLRGKEKYSAEKPLDLMLAVVSAFSQHDTLVVDPTMGVGTTGVACLILGRDFVGAELRDSVRADAERRLTAAHKGELSARDLERAARFVSDMLDRCEADEPKTPKAWERRERLLADVERVERYIAK